MLARKQKLNLRAEKHFFTLAQKARFSFFVVYYQTTLQHSQATVIVPKRVAALATERIAIKRLVYALLTEKLKNLEQNFLRMVIIVHKKITNTDIAQISKELDVLLKKKSIN